MEGSQHADPGREERAGAPVPRKHERWTEKSAGLADDQSFASSEAGVKAAVFLARLGELLTRSLEADATLRAVAQALVPRLGDICIADLIDEDGAHRAGVECGDAALVTACRRLAATSPFLEPDGRLSVLAGQSSEVLIVTDRFDDVMSRLAVGVDDPARMLPAEPVSMIVIPIVARDRLLGSLALISTGQRSRHSDADAMLGRAVARRTALALDNARLYREAQRANEAKSALLAVMSHELRTPLGAILGYTELLAEGVTGPVSPHQHEQLLRIRAASDQLLVLVEEILTFARLDAGKETLRVEEVAVESMLDQAFTLLETQARLKQLRLDVCFPETPIRMQTDPAKLRQILFNLLGHAIKFTDTGIVDIGARACGEDVVFWVRDAGTGIAEEHLSHLFEPFWQPDTRLTRRFGGAGLGLATVRRLARLLGGDVVVTSNKLAGATFEVTLPRVPQSVPSPARDGNESL